MRPLDEEKIKKFLPFLGNAQLVEFGAPEGLEESIPSAIGAKLEDGSVIFFMEFVHHEEWQDFKKNRLLVVRFLSGADVTPISIGSFKAPEMFDVTENNGHLEN